MLREKGGEGKGVMGKVVVGKAGKGRDVLMY